MMSQRAAKQQGLATPGEKEAAVQMFEILPDEAVFSVIWEEEGVCVFVCARDTYFSCEE